MADTQAKGRSKAERIAAVVRAFGGGRLPYASGSATSKGAADRMRGERAAEVRARVWAAFVESGGAGLTTDELEERTGLRHQSASPRVYELREAGFLEATSEQRRTRSNRYAVVYRIFSGAVERAQCWCAGRHCMWRPSGE